MKIKVLFLGTSVFAEKCLKYLIENTQFQVQGVITKGRKASGRGMRLCSSPVYDLAQKQALKILTPSSFKNPKDVEQVKSWGAEAVVVCAYGLIIPSYFLNWFSDRIVNIHTSLLPRWRGASPVSRCILSGDQKTGVTLQKLSERLDAGDIIHKLSFALSEDMDAQDVLLKMEGLSFDLLGRYFPMYLKGEIQPQAQEESEAVYAEKVHKSELKIDWSQKASEIFNQVRAFVIHGGAYTLYKGRRVKIFKTEQGSNKSFSKKGRVMSYDPLQGLEVVCGSGSLYLKEVQIEGRKRQSIHTALRGFEFKIGSVFE